MKKDWIKNWPKKPGVYMMMNSKNQVIYIGKAKNLFARIHSYLLERSSLKTQFLVKQIHSLDYILTQTETEAYLLEASLVKKHKPRYNVRLKDDKAYPYICLSMTDSFPRFYMERKVKRNGNMYFGPYAGSTVVKNMIQFLNENYKIRDCSNGFMKSRSSPCLTHQMGYCTAPCVQKVSQKEYSAQVRRALSFFKGNGIRVVQNLEKQMKKKADKQQFEQALEMKNRIASISAVWENQSVLDPKWMKDGDVLAYYTDESAVLFEILYIRSGRLIGHRCHFEKNWVGDICEIEKHFISFLIQYYSQNLIPDEIIVPESWKNSSIKELKSALLFLSKKKPFIHLPEKKNEKDWMCMARENAENKFNFHFKKSHSLNSALLDIQKIFKLPRYPQRIECYDISHHQSKASYGSQVVFEEGTPKKEDYRLYKLEDVNNDCLSMKTCLDRRFSHKDTDLPDLILIDGGKGQLEAVRQVLSAKHLNSIPLAGIAKPQRTHYSSNKKINNSEKFYLPLRKNPVRILENTPAFHLLIQLRNEAHRFALSRHQKKLRKTVLESSLMKVKGIGEKRKIKLLKEFKSIKGVQKAGVQKISQILGVSRQVAKDVVHSLK